MDYVRLVECLNQLSYGIFLSNFGSELNLLVHYFCSENKTLNAFLSSQIIDASKIMLLASINYISITCLIFSAIK